MKDKKTLLRQKIFKLRQTQHEVEVNFVATKTVTVPTEVEKNHKKLMLGHRNLCCNTVKKTRHKSSSRKKKIMSRQ